MPVTELLRSILPEVVLILGASAMYLAAAFLDLRTRSWAWLSLGAIVIAFVCLLTTPAFELRETVLATDSLARFGGMLALLTGAAMVLISWETAGNHANGEYFASLLLVVAGGGLVAAANDLILLFLGLELISIPTYLLLYIPRKSDAGSESTAKYFFLSIFASGMFLYGASFFYGAVGTTNLDLLAKGPNSNPLVESTGPVTILLVALILVFAGLSFKVGVVPFHFYAPDVYQGTTNTLTAILAWAPKAAGVFAMLRLVAISLPFLRVESSWIVWVMAGLTMTIGNFMGLLQDHLRRLLAYSSIAHGGYMMLGVGAACVGGKSEYLTESAVHSVAFYLFVYSVMTLGVFAGLVYLSKTGQRCETISDLRGLSRSRPWVALMFAIFMFSLTGIPITAGFWGKLALFSSAISLNDKRYTMLAVIGVLNAAVSSYYYLRIISTMFMENPDSEPQVQPGGRPALSVLSVCAALTLIVGLIPGPFLRWSDSGETTGSVSTDETGGILQPGERSSRENQRNPGKES